MLTAMSMIACDAATRSSFKGSAILRLMPSQRSRSVEPHLAAEEIVGIEAAQRDVGVGDGGLGAAAAIADRVPDRRRRSAGPTLSAPTSSIQAMLPPPAPTSTTSMTGTITGWPLA